MTQYVLIRETTCHMNVLVKDLHIWVLLSVVMLLLLYFCPVQADESMNHKNYTLKISCSKTAFLSVNQNDVEAMLKTLAQAVGRQQGLSVIASTRYYKDIHTFETAVRQGEIQLSIVDSWTFLKMEKDNFNGTPCFVSMAQGRIGKRYLILKRCDSEIKTLMDLKGQDLVVFGSANNSLGRPWLETLLLCNNVHSPETFFQSIKYVTSPIEAVLPVFFGKIGACLVDDTSFEIMTELNPQVGKKLKILKSSDLLVDGLVISSNAGWTGAEEFKKAAMKSLAEMHLQPTGQQLLALFKTDKLIAFSEEYLDTVRSLYATHELMQNKKTQQ